MNEVEEAENKSTVDRYKFGVLFRCAVGGFMRPLNKKKRKPRPNDLHLKNEIGRLL